MAGVNLSTVAFISIACLFIVLFLGCVGLSLFLCLQMKTKGHEDEKRNQAEIEKLRKRLIKKFKENVKHLQNLRPKSASNKVEDVPSRPSSAVGDKTCTICLEKFAEDETQTDDVMIGLLKHCGHYYHFDCIWAWLGQESVDPSCPVCRKDVCFTENDIDAYSFTQIVRDPSVITEARMDSTELTSVESLKLQNETTSGGEFALEHPESRQDRRSRLNMLRTQRLFQTVSSGQSVTMGNPAESQYTNSNFLASGIFPPV